MSLLAIAETISSLQKADENNGTSNNAKQVENKNCQKAKFFPYPSIHPARAFCLTKSWIPTVLITNVIVVIICVFVAVVIIWSSS